MSKRQKKTKGIWFAVVIGIVEHTLGCRWYGESLCWSPLFVATVP